MRGSPPLQLFLCIVAFVLFAIPLAKLTFARPKVEATHTAVVADVLTTSTHITLRFAHVPSSVSLKLGDKELLPTQAGDAKEATVELQADLLIPKDGLELSLKVTWPEGTPDTAATVELQPDALDSQTQTRWSTGNSLDEILTYTWKL